MAHTIDNIEITKMGMGYNLNYSVDGKDYTATGEFHIDKDGNLHHTHIVDEYFIVMCIGDKQTYVYTEDDVKHGGFVDIDPDLFMIDNEEEANRVMAELKDYVAEQGWENTTFHVEHIEEELDIVAKADNKVNDIYDLAEYINNEESYPIDVEEIAEAHGWTLPTEDDDDYLVCVDEKGRKLVLVQNKKNPFKLIAEVQ